MLDRPREKLSRLQTEIKRGNFVGSGLPSSLVTIGYTSASPRWRGLTEFEGRPGCNPARSLQHAIYMHGGQIFTDLYPFQ